MDDNELMRMNELKLAGHCCTSIIVQLGLDLRKEENEQFVNSVRVLCNGLQSGLICGALTGALCMLGLFDSKNVEMTREMVTWFESEYGQGNCSINCEDIVSNDPYKRATLCPGLVYATYSRAKQLLIDCGYICTK